MQTFAELKSTARTLGDGAESEEAIKNAKQAWDSRMANLGSLAAALKDGAAVLASTAKKVASQKRRADKMQERADHKAQQRNESEAQAGKKLRASGAAASSQLEDIFDGPMDDLPNFEAIRRIDCTQAADDARDHSVPEIFTNMAAVQKEWQEASTGEMAAIVSEFRRRYPDALQFKMKGRAVKSTEGFEKVCDAMLAAFDPKVVDRQSVLLKGPGKADGIRIPGENGLTIAQLFVHDATLRQAGLAASYTGNLWYQTEGVRGIVCIRLTHIVDLVRGADQEENLVLCSRFVEAMRREEFQHVKNVPVTWMHGTVSSGEMLYVPPGWVILEKTQNAKVVGGLRVGLFWLDGDMLLQFDEVLRLLAPGKIGTAEGGTAVVKDLEVLRAQAVEALDLTT